MTRVVDRVVSFALLLRSLQGSSRSENGIDELIKLI